MLKSHLGNAEIPQKQIEKPEINYKENILPPGLIKRLSRQNQIHVNDIDSINEFRRELYRDFGKQEVFLKFMEAIKEWKENSSKIYREADEFIGQNKGSELGRILLLALARAKGDSTTLYRGLAINKDILSRFLRGKLKFSFVLGSFTPDYELAKEMAEELVEEGEEPCVFILPKLSRVLNISYLDEQDNESISEYISGGQYKIITSKTKNGIRQIKLKKQQLMEIGLFGERTFASSAPEVAKLFGSFGELEKRITEKYNQKKEELDTDEVTDYALNAFNDLQDKIGKFDDIIEDEPYLHKGMRVVNNESVSRIIDAIKSLKFKQVDTHNRGNIIKFSKGQVDIYLTYLTKHLSCKILVVDEDAHKKYDEEHGVTTGLTI